MHVVYFEISKGNSHTSLIFASPTPNIIPMQKQLTNIYWIWMKAELEMPDDTRRVDRKTNLERPQDNSVQFSTYPICTA